MSNIKWNKGRVFFLVMIFLSMIIIGGCDRDNSTGTVISPLQSNELFNNGFITQSLRQGDILHGQVPIGTKSLTVNGVSHIFHEITRGFSYRILSESLLLVVKGEGKDSLTASLTNIEPYTFEISHPKGNVDGFTKNSTGNKTTIRTRSFNNLIITHNVPVSHIQSSFPITSSLNLTNFAGQSKTVIIKNNNNEIIKQIDIIITKDNQPKIIDSLLTVQIPLNLRYSNLLSAYITPNGEIFTDTHDVKLNLTNAIYDSEKDSLWITVKDGDSLTTITSKEFAQGYTVILANGTGAEILITAYSQFNGSVVRGDSLVLKVPVSNVGMVDFDTTGILFHEGKIRDVNENVPLVSPPF